MSFNPKNILVRHFGEYFLAFPEKSPAFVLLFLLLLLSCFQETFAQQPCFKLDFTKGCTPLTVNVTDCSGANPANVLYQFDGANTTKNTSFTYKKEGKYTITQIIGTADGGKTSSKTVEAVSPAAPRFSLLPCAHKTIRLEIHGGVYARYRIDYGDGKVQNIFPTESPTHTYAGGTAATVTVTGLLNGAADNCASVQKSIRLSDKPEAGRLEKVQVAGKEAVLTYKIAAGNTYFLEQKVGTGNYLEVQKLSTDTNQLKLPLATPHACFRIRTQDACGTNTQYSNTLCTLWPEVSSADKKNVVKWQVYPGNNFEYYTLLRDGKPIGKYGNNHVVLYTDNKVECLKTYCYQLQVNTTSGLSVSDTVCVQTVGDTQKLAPEFFFASIEKGAAVLRWKVPPALTVKKIEIEKAVQSKNDFTLLANPPAKSTEFTDKRIEAETLAYCYKISVTDDCGNTSDPKKSCTVRLTGEKSGKDNLLRWSAFEGFDDFTYQLEVYDEASVLLRTTNALTPTTQQFLDPADKLKGNTQIYRLRISNPQQKQIAYSNFFRIETPASLKIPDAFTPNGDGLNDVFKVLGEQITTFHLEIFDRWGGLIFSSNALSVSWDGTLQNGKQAPQGAYTWVIKAETAQKKPLHHKGMILLIR